VTTRTQFTLSVAALCLALAGCGAKPDEHPGRVQIAYWEKWTGFEGDAMRATVNAFNESQDKIWCDLLTISQVDQKMLLATAGKNPPDVAGLWTFNLNVFADNGSIIPLDDYCRKHGIGRDHYIPCYWDMVQHRGHTWALLSTPASIGLYWNKQLFREAGLDPDRPPRTMTELWDFSKKLTVKNPDGSFKRLGFMQSEPGWWHWAWG
jgi:ABC-type glycerol-3-phosphate transport system substrate-binding protein